MQTIPVGDALLITVPTELKRQRKISKLLVNFKLQLLSIQDNLERFQGTFVSQIIIIIIIIIIK